MTSRFEQRLAVSRGPLPHAMVQHAIQAWLGESNPLINIELARDEEDRLGIDYRVKHRYGTTDIQAKTHTTLGPNCLWVETVAPNGKLGWLYTGFKADVLLILYPRQGVAFVLSVRDLIRLQELVLQYEAYLDTKSGPGESKLVGIPLEMARYYLQSRLRIINFPHLDPKLFPGPPQEELWLGRA